GRVLHKSILRAGILLMALVASLLMNACVPTSEESINTELFKSKDDLKVKTGQLKPGMNKEQAFKVLSIAPEKFQRMSLAEVQASVYGNSQVQGSPAQLEEFKQRMLRYEGYSLPYRAIKGDSSLGFGTMKVHKTGQDLRLVLIFEHDKLL